MRGRVGSEEGGQGRVEPGVKGAVQGRKTGTGKHAGRGLWAGDHQKQEQPERSRRCAETQSGASLLEASTQQWPELPSVPTLPSGALSPTHQFVCLHAWH